MSIQHLTMFKRDSHPSTTNGKVLKIIPIQPSQYKMGAM